MGVAEELSRAERAQVARRHRGGLARSTYAIVLAGGRGSRLKQLTDWRAKPAVPFGGKFRIIDFTLSNCVNSGVRRIGVATQYKSHSLIRHVQRGWSFLDGRFDEFVELLPAQQRVGDELVPGHRRRGLPEPRHPAPRRLPSTCWCSPGDHVYKMDYAPHARGARRARRRRSRSRASRCRSPTRAASACMSADAAGRITGFEEKPRRAARRCPAHPDTRAREHGHLRVQRAVPLRAADRATPTTRDSSHDFGKDLIPHCVGRGTEVYAHRLRTSSCVEHDRTASPTGATSARSTRTGKRTSTSRKVTPAAQPLRPRLADLDLPGAAAAGEVRLRRRRPPRHGDRLAGLGRLHRRAARRCAARCCSPTCACTSARCSRTAWCCPTWWSGPACRLRRAVVDRHCRLERESLDDPRRFRVTDKGLTLITPEMLGQPVHQLR